MSDELDLKRLGYVQELARGMSAFSNFAISFSVISILTGAIQLFGYGLQHGGPLQIGLGWWLVSLMTMTVALSMAELASAYPTAGALYHWSSFLGGRGLGWITACFNLIGLLGVLAGVDYGLSQLLIGLLGWPATPLLSVGLYAGFLFTHALCNHFGVKIVAWLNNFSAWYQMAVVLALLAALVMAGPAQPASFLLTRSSSDGYSYPYSFLIGLLLAQWILVGYDASAHVTEETENPRTAAPRGILLSVGVSVIVGFVLLAVLTLSIPDLAQAVGYGDNAFSEILKLRLGAPLGMAFVGAILVIVWLCGLATLTSASRMVYAFARDGGLPFSRALARVSPTHQVPANAIWALSALAFSVALSVKLYSAVVSMAVVAIYLSYGLPILAAFVAGRKLQKGPFTLGRLSPLVRGVALLWVAFITVVFVLPPNEQSGEVLAVAVSGLAILWFARVRKRFRGPANQ